VSQSQSQSQTQTLNLSLSIDNSGNPELERRVFNDVHSPGRQLSRISAVVEVLLNAVEGHIALQQPAAVASLQAFRELQRDIEAAKLAFTPEQQIVTQLRELAARDPAAHARATATLSSYLQESAAPR
jgi:hypothetical protein